MQMSLNEVFAKHLECPICLERLKEPKALYCMHTFCKSCIEQIVDDRWKKHITCPTCRYVTKVPSVQSLRPNYIAEGVMQALDEESAKKKFEEENLKKKVNSFLKKLNVRQANKTGSEKSSTDGSSTEFKFSSTIDIDHFKFKNPSFASHVSHENVILGVNAYHPPPALLPLWKNPDLNSCEMEAVKSQFLKPIYESPKLISNFQEQKKLLTNCCSTPIDFTAMAKSFSENKIKWFSSSDRHVNGNGNESSQLERNKKKMKDTKRFTDFVCTRCKNNFSVSDEIDKARVMIMSIELGVNSDELLNYINELNLKTNELINYQKELFEMPPKSLSNQLLENTCATPVINPPNLQKDLSSNLSVNVNSDSGIDFSFLSQNYPVYGKSSPTEGTFRSSPFTFEEKKYVDRRRQVRDAKCKSKYGYISVD